MKTIIVCLIICVLAAACVGCTYSADSIELRNLLKEGTENYERNQAIGDGEVPDTPQGLVDTWSKYYWPEYLPEGYELTGAEGFGVKIAEFTSEDGLTKLTMSQESYLFATGDTSDTETVSKFDVEDINPGRWEGHLYTYENGEKLKIYMTKDIDYIKLTMTGSVNIDELLKIAEGIKFKE